MVWGFSQLAKESPRPDSQTPRHHAHNTAAHSHTAVHQRLGFQAYRPSVDDTYYNSNENVHRKSITAHVQAPTPINHSSDGLIENDSTNQIHNYNEQTAPATPPRTWLSYLNPFAYTSSTSDDKAFNSHYTLEHRPSDSQLATTDELGRVRLESIDVNNTAYLDPTTTATTKRRFQLKHIWNDDLKDTYAGVAYLIHIAGMIAVAAVYGPTMVNSDNWQVSWSQVAPACSVNYHGVNALQPVVYCADLEGFSMASILFFSTLIGALWSYVWLKIAQHTYTIMNTTFGFCLAAYVTCTVIFIFVRMLPLGVSFLFFGLIECVYVALIRHKLSYTHAVMKTSTGILHNNKGVLSTAYAISLFSIGYYLLFIFCFTAAFVSNYRVSIDGPVNNPVPGVAMAFTLLSLYWTTHLLQFTNSMITSGVVAQYHLKPDNEHTVGHYIRHVFQWRTYSALCLAALTAPVAEGLRQLIKQSFHVFGHKVLALKKLGDRMFKYSNHYALTALACEPNNWTRLSIGTYNVIAANDIIRESVNLDISSTVTTFAGFAGGMCSAIMSGMWASTVGFDGIQSITLMAFIMGWAASSIVLSSVQASVATTLICWATDEASLQGNHPEITAILNEIVEPGFSRKTSMSRSFYVGGSSAGSERSTDDVYVQKLQPIVENEEKEQPTYTDNVRTHSIDVSKVTDIDEDELKTPEAFPDNLPTRPRHSDAHRTVIPVWDQVRREHTFPDWL